MIAEFFSVNSFITHFFLQSTICIAVGLLGSLALRHRAARAHQILFLTIITAIALPVISVVVKHYELGMFEANQVLNESTLTQMTAQHYDEALPPSTVEDSPYSANVTEARSPSLPMRESKRIKLTCQRVLVWGWIVATLALITRLVVTFMLGLRLLRQAKPVRSQKIKKTMLAAKEKLGFEKDVRLLYSNSVPSPVIWGWKRQPVMLLQSGAETIGDHVDWVSLFCHELAHCKRHDHISGLIAELVVCLLPWQPLLWWAKSRLIALSEQACDDWVVASGSQVTDYAESLLDVVPQGKMGFAPAVVSSRRGLVGRVRRILKDGCGEPRIGVVWGVAVTAIATCLAIGAAFAQTRPAKPQSQEAGQTVTTQMRVLHFPEDRTIGQIFVLDGEIGRRIDDFYYWVRQGDWQYFAQAMGDVAVPADKKIWLLIVNQNAWRDLSPLTRLKADDLCKLSIHGSYTGGPKPGNSCTNHLTHLTGLRILELDQTSISDMSFIENLTSLEYLTVPEWITDAGIAKVSKLPRLKGLYFRENRVTNESLSHLAKSTSLEELSLGGERIDDAGLIHLGNLPKLRYLLLGGKNFTDRGMAHLRNISSLRILNLGYLDQLTNAALPYVAEIPNLEAVSFHWSKNITNQGIAHLEKIRSLRKLVQHFINNATIKDF